jgi:hypothetical protein
MDFNIMFKSKHPDLNISLEWLEEKMNEIKKLYVADIIVDEVHKYKCSDDVFLLAEEQSKYIKNKNVKQGYFNF